MNLLYSKLEEYISDFLIENSASGNLEDGNASEIASRFLETFKTNRSNVQVLSFLEKLIEIEFFSDLLDKFFYHLVLGTYIPGIDESDMAKYKKIRGENMEKSFAFALNLIKERSTGHGT